MGINIARGNDRVDVQIGRVTENDPENGSENDTGNRGKDAGGRQTRNIRSGQARVGRQVEEIHGGLII